VYFKKLELQGFKSFAEPVTIEFNQGITCIVGPNGSGKSNISDAIRWVLGEQSPKTLRGGKMEDVIFAGTANRKSRGMAEVTLTIDNSDHSLAIDYNEVAITRRMYRSGESEYLINKVPCRLKDIRELIMDTGIGVDGYSIIGQGKIAEIVSGKPESRREMFEEAAGIVKYRTKKSEAERKLVTAKGNVDRVNDIITEIQSRIDTLKEDSIKAKEYLELRERYKAIEINVVLKNIENIELKNEYIKDEIAELTYQIESYREEKEAIDKEVEDSRKRSEELELLGGETQQKLFDCIEEINSLASKGQLDQEKLQTIEKDRARLQEEKALLEEKKAKELTNREELTKNRDAIADELEAYTQDLEEKAADLEELARANSAAMAKLEEARNRIYELYSLVSNKNSEINSLKNINASLERRKEQLEAEGQQSAEAEQALAAALQEAGGFVAEAKANKEKTAAELTELRRALQQALLREKELAGKLEEVKLSMGQASARQRVIQEMEAAHEGYNYGVRFLMKSGIPGIHGVVGELIDVPKGLEVAVETALGAGVQNIVCRDDATAQAGVKALKEHKAGRLTFLPLSSIRPSLPNYENRIRSLAGFKGFGTECVSYDSKYEKAIQFLLGRVIIVDRLSNAVAMSKQVSGFRFVTLEGDVINTGGSITGGASRNTTAGLLERKGEAKRLEENLQKLAAEKETLLKEKADLTQKAVNMSGESEGLEGRLREAEVALMTAENRMTLLKAQMEDALGSRSKQERELSGIAEEETNAAALIASLEAEVAAAKEESAAAEEQVAICTAEGEASKKALDEKSEALTNARLRAQGLKGDLAGIDSLLSRIDETIQDLTLQQEAKEFTYISLAEEKRSILEGSGGALQRLEERRKERVSLEYQARQAQEERLGILNILREAEEKKNNMDAQLLDFQNKKMTAEIQLGKNETTLENYKERLWEDFEVSYVQAMEFRKKDFVMGTAVKESRDIKARMKALGEVNVGAIKEYETVSERYEFLTAQREDLQVAMDALVQIINEMDRNIKKAFKDSFDQICLNFEKTFESLFGGGTAALHLEDENNPLECGIEIVAQPPGKKLQNMNLLSGGEKTMTAIALMFAILKARPTPFCILDEVEAALDEMNIERFAAYLQKDFREIQFALVTHQKRTMEYADVLYGVTMPERGISKVISLKLGDEFEL